MHGRHRTLIGGTVSTISITVDRLEPAPPQRAVHR
jgi:hypothetical protein